MQSQKSIFYTIFILFLSICCKAQEEQIRKYVPADQALYAQIEAMDKVFFDAYNNCDLKKQDEIYADNIEFFNDKGGFSNYKTDILAATQKNVCGKVSRYLIPGSIEVYPINDYGAVEIGFHRFFNNQEPNAESKPSKFIIIWKKENEKWRIAKVVSLH